MIDFENSSPKGELVFLFKIFPFNFGSMKSSRRSEESGLKDFSGPFSVVVSRVSWKWSIPEIDNWTSKWTSLEKDVSYLLLDFRYGIHVRNPKWSNDLSTLWLIAKDWSNQNQHVFQKMTGYITIAANKLYLSKDILFLTTWCQWKDSRPCWSSLKADFRQETRRYCKSLSWRHNKLSGFWCVACRTLLYCFPVVFQGYNRQIFLCNKSSWRYSWYNKSSCKRYGAHLGF